MPMLKPKTEFTDILANGRIYWTSFRVYCDCMGDCVGDLSDYANLHLYMKSHKMGRQPILEPNRNYPVLRAW